MKPYEGLSITIIRFEAQDIVTTSCVCTPGPNNQCTENGDTGEQFHMNGCKAAEHHCHPFVIHGPSNP